ncbi:MAG: NUDIX domain-containing protein [Anaerolineales bacterium]|nr:NUDIX domain-containing protein [Anaerolineales bacterium]
MPYKFCPQCATPLVTAEIDGILRQKCPACDFVFWDNPIPVVAAIVEHEGKVILTRNKGWPEKWLGIVAGFLEKGESPENGALREVQEELGLEGEIVSFVGHYPFELRNQIIFAYHVRAEGEITLGDELESIKAVPPEEVRPWDIGTGPALKDWLAARVKSANKF